MKGLVFIIVLVFAQSFVSANEDAFDDYQPATIDDIYAKYGGEFTAHKEADILVFSDVETKRFYVEMIYLGEIKRFRLPSRIPGPYSSWFFVHKTSEEIWGQFKSQILVSEGDKEFWIPIPKSIAQIFKEEIKEGEAVGLYLILGGAQDQKPFFLFMALDTETKK